MMFLLHKNVFKVLNILCFYTELTVSTIKKVIGFVKKEIDSMEAEYSACEIKSKMYNYACKA